MMVYAHTDIGNGRSENQDCVDSAVLEDAVFAVVCDGMGGSNAGREASSRAVAIIKERIIKSYRSDFDINKIRNLLVAAVKTANAVVYDLGSAVPEWNGMGTTCVACLIRNGLVHTVNVGDSRAYLVTHEIRQITKDHSMVMNLYERGDITKEELKNHPKRNVITRAVGVAENVEPDYFENELPQGGAVILCTDGLSNYCDEGVMFRMTKDLSPEELPKALVKNALDNGSGDNITAAVMK
ncbi:MAG: Stp1/IreP family PP2C-type Ser/Thr phosphatase [Oscillospiraceae bacterium]|nr:Stp1/IreP family PP2C-type Ser/Thr phosphatase [Oscillospiraceae bacterium]MDD7278974.1 Stp1/IreP family PP2C-type Ser/Thr phosphatase [Oscillospiraceae bacterium]MDY2864367.1 Stp1/IreP family PP2C-type Ser/Thr phosphatase [Oscillospiraceae bacterium]